MNFRLKKINGCKLHDIPGIHVQALPGDILPNLRQKFLGNYKKRVSLDESQFIFGAYSEGELLGSCLVSTNQFGVFGAVLNFGGLPALFRLVLRQPHKILIGAIQAIKKERIGRDAAEISFIAVSPRHQGKSIESALVDFFNQWCSIGNINYLQTKTANERLLNYYINECSAEALIKYSKCGKNYSEVRWATFPKKGNACPA